VVAGVVARIYPGAVRFLLALLSAVVVVIIVVSALMPEVAKGG
jgi:hypothetical protein